jgi:F-type H+-transporting ATPase subunit b
MRTLVPIVATAGTAAAEPLPRSEMDVSGRMVVLTWVSFALAAIILHRIAWKPMLTALERREARIRKSVEDADKARRSAELAEARQREMLAGAVAKAQEIVDDARTSAAVLAATIEEEARTQARRLVDEAAAEIENSRRKALESLRGDAALLAADMAERILTARAAGPAGEAFTERTVRDLEGHDPT